jgi:transposase
MTIPELAACLGVHPTKVTGWKRPLQEGVAEIFEKVHNSRHDLEAQMDELYRQIGRLQVERDFF